MQITKEIDTIIETAGRFVPADTFRANGNGKPRFMQDSRRWFNGFMRWLKIADLEEPPYKADSRQRDRWLQQFWRKESLMAGVVNSVTLIDANRGWTLTGGRNQVRKWTGRLHDSAGGQGWRYFAKKASLSFWTTDINAVIGVRREDPWATYDRESGAIIKAPMLSLENIDPGKCNLCRDKGIPAELGGMEVEGTLRYNDTLLFDWDYFRVASMPSDIEEYNDLGYCALSRALNLAKLMYAVWEYDQEKFLAKAPRGILLLHNIREEQWKSAMEAREARMSAKERQYYGSVEVLASDGGEYNPDAKLVALSQLPDGFNQETMVNLLMYGYALCFGYDIREFWPASQGPLGTGRETQEQAQKASGKGQKDFSLSLQERLQGELPQAIHFEFEERDEQGELLDAQVAEAKAKVIERLSALREDSGGVLTNEQIMQLLAQAGLVPEEWTLQDEDVTATDEEQIRQRLLDIPEVRRACEVYPGEPITRYTWDGQQGREVVLWQSGDEALRQRTWILTRTLYQGEQVTITIEDVDENTVPMG